MSVEREQASHEAITEACRLIASWTGFALVGATPRRIGDFLSQRAATLGYADADGYLGRLRSAGPGEPERERLVNLVTNGLTAFWRDEPQLEALRSVLRERAAKGGKLAIWCAGCATGEEAYTVAMIAAEAGVEAEIRATDVNTDFLSVARAGVYGDWSLRRLSEERAKRWFRREEAGWRIAPELAEVVDFEARNLLDPPPRPTRRGAGQRGWDVVMCRNVFIYFSPAAVREALGHIDAALADEGYLLLGSSEPLDDSASATFRAARYGGGFVYRKAALRPGRTLPFGLPAAPAAGSASFEPVPPAFGGDGLDEETRDLADDDALSRLLDAGRAHAAGDRRDAALACYEAALSYDPFTAEAHVRVATLIEEEAPARAAEAYRKALFLDPLHWWAAFRLASMLAAAGESRAAGRYYRQALEGLDERAEAISPAGDPATTRQAVLEALAR